jgi:hypothetical protein
MLGWGDRVVGQNRFLGHTLLYCTDVLLTLLLGMSSLAGHIPEAAARRYNRRLSPLWTNRSLFNQRERSHSLKVAAPTGTAAANTHGFIIFSVLHSVGFKRK